MRPLLRFLQALLPIFGCLALELPEDCGTRGEDNNGVAPWHVVTDHSYRGKPLDNGFMISSRHVLTLAYEVPTTVELPSESESTYTYVNYKVTASQPFPCDVYDGAKVFILTLDRNVEEAEPLCLAIYADERKVRFGGWSVKPQYEETEAEIDGSSEGEYQAVNGEINTTDRNKGSPVMVVDDGGRTKAVAIVKASSYGGEMDHVAITTEMLEWIKGYHPEKCAKKPAAKCAAREVN